MFEHFASKKFYWRLFMRALKGLLIYIGIVLAIILGIGVLIFGIMYFVPSFRIAGVGVIHTTNSDSGKITAMDEYSGYSDIELNISSKKIGVKIEANEQGGNVIDYKLANTCFGIAFDITEFKVIKSVEKVGTTLKINLIVTEPNGLISLNDSSLIVYLPKSKTFSMLINTEAGNVVIGKSRPDFLINNLTVSTTSGSLTMGRFGASGDVATCNFNSLNLSTANGKFDFSEINNVNVSNTIKLQASNGTFTFDNVNSSFNVTGKGVKLDANIIKTDTNGFKFVSENGYFNIKQIESPAGAENTIVTENCDVKIESISGRTGIVTTYGNITIGTMGSSAVLQSEHGNIKISKALDDLNINTKFGNITVADYQKSGKFVSVRGNIDVKNTGDYIKNVYTEIENTEGSIKVDNKINKLLIKTYGSSKCEVTFREIKSGFANPNDVFQHKVDLYKNSSAVVYFPRANYQPFKFRAMGNISGYISGFNSGQEEGSKVYSSKDYQYFPSSSKESQEECQKSCYFEFLGTIEFKIYVER